MSSTEEVLNHHIESFGGGDLEALMSDYTDDSIIETQAGQLKGLDAIRGMFAGMFEEFSKGESSFEMPRSSVEGDHAFIVWSAQTEDNDYHLGSDTFFIQNGKIAYQTFVAYGTPR